MLKTLVLGTKSHFPKICSSSNNHSHLEKHEVELAGGEHLLTGDAVGVLLHALLLGIREQLARHQTQQVELLHVRLEVDADAFAEGGEKKQGYNFLYCRCKLHLINIKFVA